MRVRGLRNGSAFRLELKGRDFEHELECECDRGSRVHGFMSSRGSGSVGVIEVHEFMGS